MATRGSSEATYNHIGDKKGNESLRGVKRSGKWFVTRWFGGIKGGV
jgi:hypothetical protein